MAKSRLIDGYGARVVLVARARLPKPLTLLHKGATIQGLDATGPRSFAFGACSFAFEQLPGRPAIITTRDTPSGVPLHAVVSCWTDALRKGREIAEDLLRGKSPRHGVYRADTVSLKRSP